MNTITIAFLPRLITAALMVLCVVPNTSLSAAGFSNQIIMLNSITNFKAVDKEGVVELDWSAPTTLTKKSYTVQESKDALIFEDIGVVNCQNSFEEISRYKFAHEKAGNGLIYYRIKYMDCNCKEKYSEIIFVDLISEVPAINVYPNPVCNRTLNIKCSSSKHVTVSFSTFAGRIIYSNYFTNVLQDDCLHIELPEVLQGIYVLSVIKDGVINTLKIPVQ